MKEGIRGGKRAYMAILGRVEDVWDAQNKKGVPLPEPLGNSK